MTDIGEVVSTPVAAIDVGTVTAQQLAVDFADVAEAAQE